MKTKVCFFCQQPIIGKAERHHITPRRYFRKGQCHRRGNTAHSHTSCHRRFHFELDEPRISLEGYLKRFGFTNPAFGIFAQEMSHD